MKCIKNRVAGELLHGNIGSNLACDFHPCHFKGQNCSFCYCPFYPCNDVDFGKDLIAKKTGNLVWDCSSCFFIHRNDVVEFCMGRIREYNITDPSDERLKGIFAEAKDRLFRKGKAVMVLGATSDAGKSITVAAICRILSDRGNIVAPFKSQNMSLNSRVTRAGHEISMIQDFQCRAAGIKSPTFHVNPILLKPKGDCISQVIVEGVPFGDYDVKRYYSEFVPVNGTGIVKRNIEYLKNRCDFIVMEGAGSPAEINIYDADIANMRAAEIADADCILVVNMEWGGSFAYVVGTIELLREEDRRRIKGILLNNVRGKLCGIRDGARKLEKIIGIPVIGIVPHLNVRLPKEDSECFRETDTVGNGKNIIAVIRLPHIANFTDIDPLLLEDVTIRFVSSPESLDGADIIIIPGTKNTMSDLVWMNNIGLSEAIKACRGRIPILGLCGGYQMMGTKLLDPNGIESTEFLELEGLGLFNNTTSWSEYEKIVTQDVGTFILTGEEITGYEIHMGTSQVNEKPLFNIKSINGDFNEGSCREEEMLFGSYLHGLMEKPSFRKYIMALIDCRDDAQIPECEDLADFEERNIKELAKGFSDAFDMKFFDKIFSKGVQ